MVGKPRSTLKTQFM